MQLAREALQLILGLLVAAGSHCGSVSWSVSLLHNMMTGSDVARQHTHTHRRAHKASSFFLFIICTTLTKFYTFRLFSDPSSTTSRTKQLNQACRQKSINSSVRPNNFQVRPSPSPLFCPGAFFPMTSGPKVATPWMSVRQDSVRPIQSQETFHECGKN